MDDKELQHQCRLIGEQIDRYIRMPSHTLPKGHPDRMKNGERWLQISSRVARLKRRWWRAKGFPLD